ncbi:MAG: phage holin family protein [Bacteroidia bacterium]|nr:phage holin family protein [Bacteroidia bacterium]
MKQLNYMLNGFGYESSNDFQRALCGYYNSGVDIKFLAMAALGALRMVITNYVGIDLPVFWAFTFLVAAEFWTGVKVARKIRNDKFRSRPMGRMLLKIGTYIVIISVLNTFAKSIDAPDIMGLSLNPFVWLYYTVFIAIVFQLLISWLENLGSLGYKETKTIAGFILRRFNKWFEFDGSKDNEE